MSHINLSKTISNKVNDENMSKILKLEQSNWYSNYNFSYRSDAEFNIVLTWQSHYEFLNNILTAWH